MIARSLHIHSHISCRAVEVRGQPAQHTLPAQRVRFTVARVVAEAFVPHGDPGATGNGVYSVTDSSRRCPGVPVVLPGMDEEVRLLYLQELAAHAEGLTVLGDALALPSPARPHVPGPAS